jgi:hypothetical protein
MINTYPDGSIEVTFTFYICPRCGAKNNDNLPVLVGESIEMGGCSICHDDSQATAGHLCAGCGCEIIGEESLCDDCLVACMGQGVSWCL